MGVLRGLLRSCRPRWIDYWGRLINRPGCRDRRGLEAGGDPHEIGDRLSHQLPHHIRAMQLDGSFLGAELAGDLLVQHSLDHEPEDLALAWRECRESLLQLAPNPPSLTQFGALNQGGSHRAKKLVLIKRLEQEVCSSRLHSDHACFNVSESGHEDYRHGAASPAYRALHVEAIHLRHPDVQ